MIKKIALFILPLHYYIILCLGIFISYFDGFSDLSHIIFNLIAVIFFLRIGIILHEIGHLVFAKIAGGEPNRIILGNGYEILRFEVYNVKVILNQNFRNGGAIATFNSTNYLKMRFFIYMLGGALTNLFCAYLFHKLFGFDLNFVIELNNIDLSSSFIIANLLLLVFSLLPYYTTASNGIKTESDGLRIIKLPFYKVKEVKKSMNMNQLYEASEFFESKEYDKAISIFKKYEDNEETKLISKINLGMLYSKKGNLEKGYSVLESCLSLVEDKKNKKYKPIIYNALAWYCLIRQDYTNIDLYSKTAISILPNNNHFKGTRGSVLIEMGLTKQGIKYLKPLVDFEFPNSETINAAIYLYYAMHLEKNDKEKQNYLTFIQKNIKLLESDDKIIWELISKRIDN